MPAPSDARRAPLPSSSRMFAGYLADLEQLLDDQQWDAALREALDLPRLAVALADPHLRCPGEQVKTWCDEWIQPPAEGDTRTLDSEHLSSRPRGDVAESAGPEGIPTRALRRLQLRRHVRMPPRGFGPGRVDNLPPEETATRETCTTLLEAARRWYARSACHDTTVQGNLARLAVLR